MHFLLTKSSLDTLFNANRFFRAHSISSKNIETPLPPGRKAFLQHTHVRLNLLP